MKAKDLIEQAKTKFSASFMKAIKDGDEKALAEAIADFAQQMQDAMLQEANEASTDNAVLAARGVRVLTAKEQKYYQALIQAMESGRNVQQAITNLEIAMPETIIDAVMDDIKSEFPLLDAIDFVNTTGITKWYYNKQGTQAAVWGALDSEIVKELAGDIGEMNMAQCKLTAYMIISKDFLALGPVWLDRYIRSILAEANGLALEMAVVDGEGNNSPIGMTRDLSNGTTSEGVTKYSRKTEVKVKTLDPVTYGGVLANLTKTASGRSREVKKVILVVNPVDYLSKVMPATTILTPQGTYVSDVLPFPTEVIQSIGVPKNHAVIGLAERYFLGMGTSKRGTIDYSDHTQFLEDNRVYTTHLYGNGRPLDNTAFEYLDIPDLEAPALFIKTVTETANVTAEGTTEETTK